MTKADRLPGWRRRRMSADQLNALDRLEWHDPPPAEAARLKIVLGWKRSREETLALAREFLDDGLLESVAARRAGVSTAYLRRLLRECVTPLNAPLNPSVHAAVSARTCESGIGVQPSFETVRERPSGLLPIRRFRSCEELDRWLDSRGVA